MEKANIQLSDALVAMTNDRNGLKTIHHCLIKIPESQCRISSILFSPRCQPNFTREDDLYRRFMVISNRRQWVEISAMKKMHGRICQLKILNNCETQNKSSLLVIWMWFNSYLCIKYTENWKHQNKCPNFDEGTDKRMSVVQNENYFRPLFDAQ